MKHATKKGKSGKKCFSSTRKTQHGKTRHQVQRGGEHVMGVGQIIGTYDPASGIGTGTITYVNGNIYIGEWNELLQKNGKGRMTYVNGGVYEGQWLNDERSGHGIYRRFGMNMYEGQWLNDIFSGHGIYRYQDGAVYEGSFMDNNFNGEGTLTYPDNEVATKIDYVGEWKDDEQHGTGIMRYKNGRVYNGLWKNGIEHPLFVNGG